MRKASPILFLDIDGVLNHPGSYMKYGEAQQRDPDVNAAGRIDNQSKHVELLFDPRCVGVLNAITNVTGAELVLSSSWRMWYWDRRADFRGLLRRVGVFAPVIDFTPRRGAGGIQRGDEIVTWLRAQRIQRHIAVVDDDSDMDAVRPWFVQTNGATGLLETDAPAVIDRLTKVAPWK